MGADCIDHGDDMNATLFSRIASYSVDVTDHQFSFWRLSFRDDHYVSRGALLEIASPLCGSQWRFQMVFPLKSEEPQFCKGETIMAKTTAATKKKTTRKRSTQSASRKPQPRRPPPKRRASAHDDSHGLVDTIENLFDKLGDQAEPILYALLCDDRHPLHRSMKDAAKKSGSLAMLTLAPMIVANFAVTPALAAMIVGVVIKAVATKGPDKLCEELAGKRRAKSKSKRGTSTMRNTTTSSRKKKS